MLEKMALGSTCDPQEDLEAPLHHDPFLDSEEIGCNAFATVYSPEEDSEPI